MLPCCAIEKEEKQKKYNTAKKEARQRVLDMQKYAAFMYTRITVVHVYFAHHK